MTQAQFLQIKAAAKAARDAYWAVHGGPEGSKVTAKQAKLYKEMVAANKACQAAQTAYVKALTGI